MTILPVTSPKLLTEDARNRTLRTLVQNLAIDVGVAVLLWGNAVLRETEHWGDLEWDLLALTFIKTALASAASFVMRRWLDQSPVPTPLPPKPQPEPAEPAPRDTLTDSDNGGYMG